MTYHARPLPANTGTDTGTRIETGTDPHSPAGADAEPTSRPAPAVPAPQPTTTAGGARPAAVPADVRATSWPWYRREPWLATELAAFLPMTAALYLPQAFRVPLAGLSALLVVLGLALLVRQGPFREHPGPRTGPGDEAARRRADR